MESAVVTYTQNRRYRHFNENFYKIYIFLIIFRIAVSTFDIHIVIHLQALTINFSFQKNEQARKFFSLK